MNLQDFSALMLSIDGVRVELHQTKAASFNRWFFNGQVIAWHRPLSKKDLAALAAAARVEGRELSQGLRAGNTVAMHVADLGEKLAWILAAPTTCFDSPHFTGYAAVLIDLENADPQVVFEIAQGCIDGHRSD